MACNSCAKPFTLFRKEKGCPNCGFSYCSNCLNNKIFIKKLNHEAKVCSKCKTPKEVKKEVEPPDAYFKQLEINKIASTSRIVTQEIEKRLENLKEDKLKNNDEIVQRLQNIKGSQPTASDSELRLRLANLKGIPVVESQNKPVISVTDNRSDQEKADELMKCYIEQTSIDKQYKDGFEKQIEDIESRIQRLRGNDLPNNSNVASEPLDLQEDTEGEDAAIKRIIDKVKADSLLDGEDDILSKNDELPFCEICNEDARMRCLGCRYLFCKTCFMEHKDDDDGCNRYENYEPPKSQS